MDKEKKEFECPNCGKIMKTEHTYKMHKKACDRKYNETEVEKSETPKESKVEVAKQKVKEFQDKQEKNIWEVRKEKLEYIRKGNPTYEKAVELGKMFTQITGKPQQSLTCPSCLYFMYNVCMRNVDKHLK